MRLLLDRRGDDVKITEEVVEAAAENEENVVYTDQGWYDEAKELYKGADIDAQGEGYDSAL